MEKKRNRKCCLCGAPIAGWGNSPWPLADSGQCCRECNYLKVLPARIKMLEASASLTESMP